MSLNPAGLRRWLLGPAAALVLAGSACPDSAPVPPSGANPPAMSPSSAPSELAASEPGPYELGREALTLTLSVPEDRRERLAALAGGSRPGRVRLAVEGIETLRPGGVYEVHLAPPEDASPGAPAPSLVGHVAIYGKAGTRPSTRTFDVTGHLQALLRNRPDPASLRVVFVPAESLEKEEAGTPPGPVLRFRRVALVEKG